MTGLEIKLGSLLAGSGELRFALVVQADGTGYLQVYVAPLDGRRMGIVLEFGASGIAAIRAKLDEVEAAIERVKIAGGLGRLRK